MSTKKLPSKALPFVYNAFESTQPIDQDPSVTADLFCKQILAQVLEEGQSRHGWEVDLADLRAEDFLNLNEAAYFSPIVAQGVQFDCSAFVTLSQPWDGTIWRVLVVIYGWDEDEKTNTQQIAEFVTTPLDKWSPTKAALFLHTTVTKEVTY